MCVLAAVRSLMGKSFHPPRKLEFDLGLDLAPLFSIQVLFRNYILVYTTTFKMGRDYLHSIANFLTYVFRYFHKLINNMLASKVRTQCNCSVQTACCADAIALLLPQCDSSWCAFINQPKLS